VATFVGEARALADRLPEHRYVINLHADRYRFLRAFCAAIIAGQCTLMPPNRQPHTLRQLAETYEDCYELDEDREPGFESSGEASMPHVEDERLCAIAFTSGSTGKPKPNNKYWRTLTVGTLGNARLLLDRMRGPAKLVATVPAQHMWGLETSILLPMFAPVTVSHRTPFYPQDIADAVAEQSGDVILVSSPIHLETLLRSGVKLQGVRRILTATAPLSRELAMNLERAFATEVKDVFGCSESGILATRNTAAEDLWTYGDLFALTATEKGVRIRAGHLPEDVLMPDVVELVGERQYRWIGRQTDMVNIAGKRGSLADLNHRLHEIPGIVDGLIFARDDEPERLAALVVAPGVEVHDILAQLRERIEPVFLPRPMYKVDMLPRQETGKIAIHAVRDLFDRMRASRAG